MVSFLTGAFQFLEITNQITRANTAIFFYGALPILNMPKKQIKVLTCSLISTACWRFNSRS
jgi:hypothetical protein